MARYKKFITCRRLWNISLYQQVPGSGYECPHCSHKRKKAHQERQLQSEPVTKNILSAL